MSKRVFSPRVLFLLALVIILGLTSCGGGPEATEAPATEEATEAAPATPTFEVISILTETLFPEITQSAGGATATPFPSSTPVSQSVTPSPGGEPAPALPEYRRLTLEFPASLKAGAESDIVRLTLEVDSLGNITPTAEFEGNVVEGEVIEIPNLYATHIVTAEAFFDVAGLEVKPSGPIFQPLKQGESVTFHWSVRAAEVGRYRGTIWLYLNFENRSSGEKSRNAVSAQIVEIEAVDFFGFSTNFVRTSGVVGSVLGVIVGLPFFDDVLKYLWGRAGKGKKKRAKSSKKT